MLLSAVMSCLDRRMADGTAVHIESQYLRAGGSCRGTFGSDGRAAC